MPCKESLSLHRVHEEKCSFIFMFPYFHYFVFYIRTSSKWWRSGEIKFNRSMYRHRTCCYSIENKTNPFVIITKRPVITFITFYLKWPNKFYTPRLYSLKLYYKTDDFAMLYTYITHRHYFKVTFLRRAGNKVKKQRTRRRHHDFFATLSLMWQESSFTLILLGNTQNKPKRKRTTVKARRTHAFRHVYFLIHVCRPHARLFSTLITWLYPTAEDYVVCFYTVGMKTNGSILME